MAKLCTFNTDGPPWKCTHCHRTYTNSGVPSQSVKPPFIACENAPDLNSQEHRERTKQKMMGELQSVIDSSDVPQCDKATISEQLDKCLTPCKEFNGRTCTLRGSDCKKWTRWKEFLACTGMPCRNFEPSSGEP